MLRNMPGPADFQDHHPDIHWWLVTNSETSGFARSLLKRLSDQGSITEKQAWRVRHMIACEERQLLRAQRPARNPKRPLKGLGWWRAATLPVEPRE
jgi:hypothetical protein